MGYNDGPDSERLYKKELPYQKVGGYERVRDTVPELPPINEARIQAHLDRFEFTLEEDKEDKRDNLDFNLF